MMIATASRAPPRPIPKPGKLALFVDFDGTLVELGPTPDAVSVLPFTVSFLARLQEKLGNAFSVISGRPIVDLDRFLYPLAFAAAGCHGAEIRLEPGGHVYARAEPIPSDIVRNMKNLATHFPGTIFENKIFGICLHFGSSQASHRTLMDKVAALIAGHEEDLNIVLDASGCEIKQRHIDKGTAIKELLVQPPFKNRTPIYIGDDLADCEAFIAVKEAGGFDVQVGVIEAFSESRLVLPSVAAVYEWLKMISNDTISL